MIYTRFALDALVDRTLEALAGKPMVFFVGAGASAASPTCLPQAETIQRAVYECVAPEDAEEKERELVTGSLPEIYHEVLLEVGGPSARDIWRILTLWESPTDAPALAGYELGPNIVHLLVVYLSWKTRRPIVTVNFDQMLERAASALGICADTDLDAVPDSDSVAIWKLHGSVENPESIRTTLQGITAVDPAVHARLKREFARSTGCLIGYSGKDIDFFPFLCDWATPRSIYWLSKYLCNTAITRFPGPFLGVDAPAEEWARKVVSRMPGDDPVSGRLKAWLDRPLPAADEVNSAYNLILRQYANQVFEDLFPIGHPKRLIAHAMSLAALGNNTAADYWVERFLRQNPKGVLACRAHMLKSALAHEFAQYRDSRSHARIAGRLARENNLDSSAAEAILREDEANRMLFVPPRLSCVRAHDLIAPRSLLTCVTMLVHAITLRRFGRKRDRRATPGYSDLRANFEYLEHLVRAGGLLQGWAERLWPNIRRDQLAEGYWRWIERQCYRAGYALGVGNAKKYRLRWRPPGEERKESLSVLDLYDLVPSPTGTAIHHRDVAEQMASQLQAAPLDPQYARTLDLIVNRYNLALCAVQEAGDPSLELKIMFGLKQVVPDLTWSPEEISGLLSSIQSPAYARLAHRIVAELANTPSGNDGLDQISSTH